MKFLIYLEIFVLAGLCTIPFIIDKKFKFYNPMHLVSIIYLISFGLSTLYTINNENLFLNYDYLRDSQIAKSMLFIIAIFAFFLIGYYLPQYDRNLKTILNNIVNFLPSLNDYTLTIKNLPFVLVVFEIFGWAARLYIIKIGVYSHLEAGIVAERISGFNLYAQYIHLFSILPIISMLLVFIEYLKKKSSFLLFFSILLLMLEIIYALPSGGKERVLMPIFFVLLLFSLKNKLSNYAMFSTIIFFLLFIFPFTNIFKLVYSGRLVNDLIDSFEMYALTFSGKNQRFLDELLFYSLGQRLNYTEVVTNIIENTPRIWDFKFGSTYIPFLYTLIPRFIWKDKPEIGEEGLEFAFAYGYNQSFGAMSSIATSWMGEAFLNFGWFGIFIGLSYGLLYLFIYIYFLRKKSLSNISAIFYCFAFYSMVRIEGDFAITFGGLVKLFFTLLLFLFPFIRKIKE